MKEVGHLLDESTRRIDTVGRVGAAEYAVVLPETDEHTGFLLAEQVLARIRRTQRERTGSSRSSIGVAAYPKHASSAEALMAAGDSASQVERVAGMAIAPSSTAPTSRARSAPRPASRRARAAST